MTFITNTTYGGETRRYDYCYDMLGRLARADYSGNDPANGGAVLAADFSTAYSYDLQGNILTLTRQGLIAPDLYGRIDDLTATLRGNRLVGLRDDADDVLLESSLDLRGGDFGEGAFGYDRNGNQMRDMSRGVAEVAYNVLNLPQRVEMEDGSAIAYTYSASGAKLTETVILPDGNRVTARMYKGPFEVRLDSVMTPNGLSRLVPRDTVIHLADGYLTMADTVFHAYIADYQGNITGVYNTRTDALEQFTDYYPYGMPHAMAVASSCSNRRKFGGKELTTDRGLNLYDFETRWMNAGYPTFTTQDQMAEKYYQISPHVFCAGDPINFTDPTGMTFTEIAQKWINKLTEYAMQRINNNHAEISSYENALNSPNLSVQDPKTITDKIQSLKEDNTNLSNMLNEFNVLAESSQVYDLVISDEYGNDTGTTRFNTTNKSVEIVLPNNSSLDLAAHEFKHAYQFEMGEYGMTQHHNGYPIYDYQDEVEAYERSALIYGDSFSDVLINYNHLQIGPSTVKSWISDTSFLDSPKALQRLAIQTKSIFRWNGRTYVGIR